MRATSQILALADGADAEAFRAAGYRAACIHGTLPKAERDRLVAGLGTGEIEVLTSCDLISEGLDVPALGAVILPRPTQSLVLHMQQIGRGLRPAPGKEALVVLDHVGNIERHRRPDFERIWALDGIQKKPGAAPVRICPECEGANPAGGGRRAPMQEPGFLSELPSDRLRAILAMSYRQVVSTRLSEAELRVYQEFRGYRPGWVYYRLLDQGEA